MPDTSEVIRRFDDAFLQHDPGQLDDLVGEECVMEAIQPAPDGARYEGRAACLAFWQALADDRATQFETEEITVAGDRAIIQWRYRYTPVPLTTCAVSTSCGCATARLSKRSATARHPATRRCRWLLIRRAGRGPSAPCSATGGGYVSASPGGAET